MRFTLKAPTSKQLACLNSVFFFPPYFRVYKEEDMKKLSLRVFKIRGPDWDTREKIKYSFFFLRLLGIISLLSATMILAEPCWKHSPCRLEWSSILESGGGLDGSLWEIRDTVPANIKLGYWHRSCREEQTTKRRKVLGRISSASKALPETALGGWKQQAVLEPVGASVL